MELKDYREPIAIISSSYIFLIFLFLNDSHLDWAFVQLFSLSILWNKLF